MNKHNHLHDHCEHSNVKFCSHCNLVYCLDCSFEWKQNYNYFPYWGIYPTITSQDPTYVLTTTSDTYTLNSPNISYTNLHNH